MKTTVIYLIRHSSPEYQTNENGELVIYGPDVRLTEEGKQKAEKLAEIILAREKHPLDAIYSSPLKRAHETALILARKLQLDKVNIIEKFQDTKSTWAGTPVAEFLRIFHAGEIFEDPHSLETLDEISIRMVSAYQSIVVTHSGQRIGIVSHGDPLRVLYDRIRYPEREIPPYPELVQELSLDTAQSLRMEISAGEIIESEIIPADS